MYYDYTLGMSMGSTMDSCDAAVVTIACAVTFIVTLIFTAIITFTVTYVFVKKTLSNITQDTMLIILLVKSQWQQLIQ